MADRHLTDATGLIRTVVAYHEAGRAVVAAALGHDVYEICVDDSGGAVGHRPSGDGARDPETELVILVAGPCAERRVAEMTDEALAWCGEQDDVDVWLAAMRDLESGAVVYGPDADGVWPDNDALALAWILGPVSDGERQGKIDDAKCSAVEILTREWRDVDAVAWCLGAQPLRGSGCG